LDYLKGVFLLLLRRKTYADFLSAGRIVECWSVRLYKTSNPMPLFYIWGNRDIKRFNDLLKYIVRGR
jgi:hypothetical protein